jgi:anti-anti-sigma factor
MEEKPLLSVRCERRGDRALVIADGEIDMSTSAQVRAALRDPASRAPAVVLDLRGVSFMDSSGLGVVVGQHRRAREEGFRFAVVVAGATNVERVLELSGLTGVLDLVEPADALLAA